MPSGQHDASASAVGYQYQTSWCLLELLRRGPQRPDDAISLEMHDDVAWENSGTPLELLQTKHHLGATPLDWATRTPTCGRRCWYG